MERDRDRRGCMILESRSYGEEAAIQQPYRKTAPLWAIGYSRESWHDDITRRASHARTLHYYSGLLRCGPTARDEVLILQQLQSLAGNGKMYHRSTYTYYQSQTRHGGPGLDYLTVCG